MIKTGIFKRYMEYDGKRYTFHLSRKSQAAAEKIARSLRARGFSAKVDSFGPLYAVYKRRKG